MAGEGGEAGWFPGFPVRELRTSHFNVGRSMLNVRCSGPVRRRPSCRGDGQRFRGFGASVQGPQGPRIRSLFSKEALLPRLIAELESA